MLNPNGEHPIDATTLARQMAELIDEKQGDDITLLDVSGPLVIADYFVIATARNPRHAQGMAADLARAAKHLGVTRRRTSGAEGESAWVLLDLDVVIVHIFQADARQFYDLESLWADAERVEFTPAERPATEAATPGVEVSPAWEAFPESLDDL